MAGSAFVTMEFDGSQPVHSVSISAEPKKQTNRTKRETEPRSSDHLTVAHSIPLEVPFYLSCNIDSYHAIYTWEHKGQRSPCQRMQSDCLHLIPAMTTEKYGDYQCVSKERDYTKVVIAYQLSQTDLDKNSKHDIPTPPKDSSSAAAFTAQMGLIVSFAFVQTGILL